jgi:hypothetical protein
MGQIHAPWPVKLVASLFGAHQELLDAAERALAERLGPLDYRSPALCFDHTHYYEDEFGARLQRRLVAFEKLADPADLASIKVFSNTLEQQWLDQGRRCINLDPGYVTRAKLVLATTKDYAHRIYVGQGIYAEVTLSYREGDWRPWPWTYPDYRSEAYLQILREIRALYVAQLRAVEGSSPTLRSR